MNTTENTVKKPSKAEKPVKRNKRLTLYVTLFLAAAALLVNRREKGKKIILCLLKLSQT